VLSSDADNHPIPPGPVKAVRPGDLRALHIGSLEQVQDLLQKYGKLNFLRDHQMVFLDYLVQRRDAWFVEAGDRGLIYLTHIVPQGNAHLNFVFWDGRLTADRREAVRTVTKTAMQLFKLPRITSTCPYTNKALWLTLRKMEFVLEGVTRKGYVTVDGYVDLMVFGVTDDEVREWPVLSMTSSALT
jgi:hypothetical protein